VLGDSAVTVGYGAAYPLGVVGVILFVQLAPRLLGLDLRREAESAEAALRGPAIAARWFRVADFCECPSDVTSMSLVVSHPAVIGHREGQLEETRLLPLALGLAVGLGLGLGAICGAMTSTPGLGVLCSAARSQAAAMACVAAYPAALIGVVALAPLVAAFLELLT